MISLPVARVAEFTGGYLADVPDPAALVTGPVVIDSRQAEPGGLFAALPGERADGHDFAAAAVRSGAVAVLADPAGREFRPWSSPTCRPPWPAWPGRSSTGCRS